MTFYKSLEDAQAEIIINRSRFIGRVYHIQDQQQALDHLKSLKKEFSDATHICYGYVADRAGFNARFSDDGEPSGTAGQPIIDAVLRQELRQVLVAVIRYFGGIKLGTGGLARAYSECAVKAMDGAKSIWYVLCDTYEIKTSFSDSDKIKKRSSELGRVLNIQYTDSVLIKAAIPTNNNFSAAIADLSGGRAKAQKIGTGYIMFDSLPKQIN